MTVTLPIHVTYQQAVSTLRAIVNEYGADHVYVKPVFQETGPTPFEVCAYFDETGVPSCAIGIAIARWGVTREMLIEGPRDMNAGYGPTSLVQHGVLSVDAPTIAFLSDFQEFQDAGKPWGVCLQRALAHQSIRAGL